MAQNSKRIPTFDELEKITREKQIGDSDAWKNLIHYGRDYLWFYGGQVDSKDFYFDPMGSKKPDLELAATLKIFLEPFKGDDPDYAPLCRLPGRKLFLERVLEFEKNAFMFPEIKCPAFERYLNDVQSDALYLIFASGYLNNPSSAFGHTFYRLKRKANVNTNLDGKHAELLDVGLNFAAATNDNTNPIWFAVGGFSGGFPGVFTKMPYYYKIREYSDLEKRDLWSYKLNLTPDELNLFIAHIWDLGPQKFNYYFFTENCSYHVLSALEAAAPRLKLKEKLPFFIIPSDTTRTLFMEAGLVSAIEFRPSAYRVFKARYDNLNLEERSYFESSKTLGKYPEFTDSLSTESQARILDTLMDYASYLYLKKLTDEKSEPYMWAAELRMRRAKLGLVSEELKVQRPDKEAPHLAHAAQRWGLFASLRNTDEYSGVFDYCFALQDLLDESSGFPDVSEIEFFHLKFRGIPEKKKLQLDEWKWLGVKSLRDFDRLESGMAWELETGLKRFRDSNCNKDCLGAYGAFAWGPNFLLVSDPSRQLRFGLFIDNELSYAHFLEEDLRLAVGPKVQLHLSSYANKFATLVSYAYRYAVGAKYRHLDEYKLITRYTFTKEWSAEFSFSRFGTPNNPEGARSSQSETRIGFYHFF